ncbi:MULTISPECIES: DNA repair protein RecO [Cycloclasticus]|uniref:DNA repair protein RecO n=1 Tax=Cycloclasticus TaxID=34067 RepID=UPI000360D318|nr:MULTISPECIES: DNA repair protein RecO [Cycloclasticus]ATI03282.1 DNA repair protein RecO [Cycloclasticus sp. PY97N]
MNRVEHQTGFILKSQGFKENSSIHQVFTRDYGVLSILSKGSKKNNSKYGSLLQAFRALSLSWIGKSDLKTLISIEDPENIPQLKGAALYCGFYVNELILCLLHKHDAHPYLFDAYRDVIVLLSKGLSLEVHLREFEKKLFDGIGYGLMLEYDSEYQRPIDPSKYYIYHPGQGPRLTNNENHPDTVLGSTLINLNNNNLQGKTELKQAKRLMRRLIDNQLDGKILKSRDLFA